MESTKNKASKKKEADPGKGTSTSTSTGFFSSMKSMFSSSKPASTPRELVKEKEKKASAFVSTQSPADDAATPAAPAPAPVSIPFPAPTVKVESSGDTPEGRTPAQGSVDVPSDHICGLAVRMPSVH